MRINNFRKILSINLILMNILSIFNLNQKSFATITETQNQANINITNIEKGVSASRLLLCGIKIREEYVFIKIRRKKRRGKIKIKIKENLFLDVFSFLFLSSFF